VIQRFCFVKLLDHEVDTRAELADMLRVQLRGAGADAIVGLPADDSAARWDLSIVIHVESLEAWSALAASPGMTGVFDELSIRATVVKAWTFTAR
jgi:hypothetical protein